MNARPLQKTILLLSILTFLIACAASEKPAAEPMVTPTEVLTPAPTEEINTGVSYARNIKPIMLESCTPCHFPEKGRKQLLDSYAATARFIDDIIYRVQLPPDSSEFMPYKSKKMPLSKDSIQLLIDWRDQGLQD